MSANHSFATKPVINHLAVFQNKPNAEAIRCLLDSLQTADSALVNRIENQLVSIGDQALSHVLKGLTSSHAQVQATCAIVLIRWHAVAEVQAWAQRHPQLYWMSQELLALMGQNTQPVASQPIVERQLMAV